MWFGDALVVLSAVASLIYLLYIRTGKRTPLYFQMIIGALWCHLLGYLYDLCELFTTGTLAEGFTIGYLGSLGCFLFLLSAGFGCMDGILDDRSPAMRSSRYLALLAPAAILSLLVPNFFAEVPIGTKVWYALLWIPATLSSYFHLKHALLPDMGFGFVKAIRPFNLAALGFIFFQLLHMTFWNFFDWLPLLLSGLCFGAASIAMVILAEKGVRKWVL